MKKQTLLIVLILGLGGTFVGLAYGSTIVSDTSIVVQNLTVTGTCTGCGGSGSGLGTRTNIVNDTSWFVARTFDNHTNPIVITDTSEPANSQITYTVQNSDFRVPSWATVQRYGVIVSVGFHNTSGIIDGSVFPYCILTVNGADFDSNARAISIMTDTYASGAFIESGQSMNLHAGDVVGLKCWMAGGASGSAQVDYYGLMIIPIQMQITKNMMVFYSGGEDFSEHLYNMLQLPSFSQQLGISNGNNTTPPDIVYPYQGLYFRNADIDTNDGIQIGRGMNEVFNGETIEDQPATHGEEGNRDDGSPSPVILDPFLNGFETISAYG